MTQEEVRKLLEETAEEKYKKFSSSLLPGVDNILGIRLPKLREIAKGIAKDDWKACMAWQDNKYFEETMIQAMALGYAKADIKELLCALKEFIPYIDNWSVNDSLCSSFKITAKCQKEVWEFLINYKNSHKEYEVRFTAVMLRAYFLNDVYIDKTLEILGTMDTDKYYASMGVAWAFTDAWIAYPQKTKEYLLTHILDSETYKRTLQKCLQSLRISAENKKYIRVLLN